MHLTNLILLLGVVGLFGSTLGTSIFAWCVARFFRKTNLSKGSLKISSPRLSLDILIPAHNEATLISKTLCSIAYATEKLRGHQLDVSIVVGLDHTTDQTLNRIHHFIYFQNTDVSCVANTGRQGKWNMMKQLVAQSSADWVALVDSGSIWDESILREAVPHFFKERTVGVAPSYRPANAGLLERLNWSLERTLKSIESSAGGPISVHGASVFYHRESLVKALNVLNGTHWLNDDVVIPLTLRTLSPEKNLVYLAKNSAGNAWVSDLGIKRNDHASDVRRRRRMIFGNLQWIRDLFISACRADLTVGLIASRRVFRTFWAYAALCFIVGASIHVVRFTSEPSVLFLSVGSLFILAFLYKMRAAFWAGIQTPFQFFTTHQSRSSEKLWN